MTPKRYFFGLLLIIVVLVGAGGYAYYYSLQYLHQVSNKFSEQLAEQEAIQSQLDQIAHLKSVYNKTILPLKDAINTALPAAKQQSEFLSSLQNSAHEVGLELTNVTFNGTTGLPGPTTQTIRSGNVLAMPVTLQVSGTYAQVESLLNKFENLPRYTNISSLGVTRNVGNKTVTYTINMNAYVQP